MVMFVSSYTAYLSGFDMFVGMNFPVCVSSNLFWVAVNCLAIMYGWGLTC